MVHDDVHNDHVDINDVDDDDGVEKTREKKIYKFLIRTAGTLTAKHVAVIKITVSIK